MESIKQQRDDDLPESIQLAHSITPERIKAEDEAKRQLAEEKQYRQTQAEQKSHDLRLKQRSLVNKDDVAWAEQRAKQTGKSLADELNYLVEMRVNNKNMTDNQKSYMEFTKSLDDGFNNRNQEYESDEQHTLYVYAKVLGVKPSLLYGLDPETMLQVKEKYLKLTQELDPSLKTPIAKQLISDAWRTFDMADSERKLQQIELANTTNRIEQKIIKEQSLHSTGFGDSLRYHTNSLVLGTLGLADSVLNVKSNYYAQRYGIARKNFDSVQSEPTMLQKTMMGIMQNMEHMPHNMNRANLGDYYNEHGFLSTAKRMVWDQPDILGDLFVETAVNAVPLSRFKMLAGAGRLTPLAKFSATSAVVGTETYISNYGNNLRNIYQQTGNFQQAVQKARVKTLVESLTAMGTAQIPGVKFGEKPWQKVASSVANKQLNIGYGIGGEILGNAAIGERYDINNIGLTYLIVNFSYPAEKLVDKVLGWRTYNPEIESQQKFLDNLSDQVADLPIAKRAPDLVKEFIGRLKDGSHLELQEVHIPTQRILEHADKNQLDAHQWAEQVTGKKAILERALDLGTDIVISLENYLLNIVAKKEGDFSKDVKVTPDALSPKGVEEVNGVLKRQQAEHEAFYNNELKNQYSFLTEGSVYRQVFKQLREKGEQKTVASNQALLHHQFFSQLGKSLAIDSTALFSKHQLQIVTDQPMTAIDKNKTGFIQIDKDGVIKMNLNAPIDKATFLHDSGHFFLHVLGDAVEGSTHLNPSLTKDVATIKAWLKVPQNQSLKTLTKKQYGMWARSFEAYIMGGKAPSTALQGAFTRFKGWLLETYRTVRNLNVTLSDDITEVFDRMLASQEAIAQAKKGGNLLFKSAEQAGMKHEDFESYQHTDKALNSEAEQQLFIRLIKDSKREQEKFWKEESLVIRKEVAEEVNNLPVYQVYNYLNEGKLQDGKRGRAVKLDRQYIIKKYGPGVMKALKHLTSSKDGVTPEVLADVWNFKSGDELVKALLNKPHLESVINNEVTLRMGEKFGDLLATGNITNEAIKLLQSPARIKLLIMEVGALNKLKVADFLKRMSVEDTFIDELHLGSSDIRLTEPVLEKAVQDIMANLTDIEKKPDIFLAAYHSANERAEQAVAEQAWDTAERAKEQALINLLIYQKLINNGDDRPRTPPTTDNTLH